jgi:hypothetical protein
MADFHQRQFGIMPETPIETQACPNLPAWQPNYWNVVPVGHHAIL